MAKLNRNKGLPGLLKQAFQGYNPDDATNNQILLQSGAGSSGTLWNGAASADGAQENGASAQGDQWMADERLPDDRFLKYSILQEMASDPLLSGGIDLHICHALSVDSRTGQAISIEAKKPEDAELAASLMADLGTLINEGAPGWCKNMAVFGTHYIRPYATERRGIDSIESSWYTMAQNIREYERGGRVAGFTSEYLKEKESGGQIRLVEPWQLVPVRIPYWQPKLNVEPTNISGHQYSLYDDLHRRIPTETQNYGTSLFEFCYPAWRDLTTALRSLKASRNNASRIDRFITLGMDNLDPAQAANYINLIGSQLRRDMEAIAARTKKTGFIPTVINRLIPTLGGSKGAVGIDTQVISPDIQHIEDIMFHLKRMSGGLGIDASMLGWGDLMSGGLGDGGFFRTSIQAAQRANWIRQGLRTAGNRLIDIHMAHKYGKVFPAGVARPVEIKFHSLNTAIELEEAEAREVRTNWGLSLATLLDLIENGQLSKSETFKQLILNDIVQIDPEIAKKVITELAAASPPDESGGMMESVKNTGNWDEYLANKINQQILTVLGE